MGTPVFRQAPVAGPTRLAGCTPGCTSDPSEQALWTSISQPLGGAMVAPPAP